ncbi:MAG: hypothetical protein KDD38_08070 [Bdellovibrionales bacterium]|nr:hypothetical protein [Bdellovibrionales bacterium]
MNKKLIISLMAIPMIFFQNCSNVEFSPEASVNSKLADDADISDLTAEEDTPQHINIGFPSTDPDSPLNINVGFPPRANQALQTCKYYQGAGRAFLTELPPNTNIVNQSGNLNILADNIEKIENFNGNMIIVGKVDASQIGSINGGMGNIIICGMSVGHISNLRLSNISVVGGDVGSIDKVNANINVFDGDVTGDISNFRGNVLISNGQHLGNQSNVSGNVAGL